MNSYIYILSLCWKVEFQARVRETSSSSRSERVKEEFFKKVARRELIAFESKVMEPDQHQIRIKTGIGTSRKTGAQRVG